MPHFERDYDIENRSDGFDAGSGHKKPPAEFVSVVQEAKLVLPATGFLPQAASAVHYCTLQPNALDTVINN